MKMKIDQIIDEFLGSHKEWTGTPTALFNEIAERFGKEQLPVTNANTLSRMLSSRNAEIREHDVDIEHGRFGTARRITLRRTYSTVELIKCPKFKTTVIKIIKNANVP
jgi:hypothetical protein